MDPSESEKGRLAGGTEQSWCRAVPGGTGNTVLSLSLSQPLDPTLLQTALHKLQNSHPILRATLASTNAGHSYTVSPAPYLQVESFDAAATSEILGDHDGGEGPAAAPSPFHRLVEHELNRNPWVDTSAAAAGVAAPVFFAATYAVPRSGSSVVALRLHTSVCDRTAGSFLLKELLNLVMEAEDGGGGVGGEMLPGIEEMVPKEHTGKPFWARGRDVLGYSLNFARSACLPFANAAAPDSSEMARLVLTAEETGQLLSACEVREVKLCEVLTAAALIATITSKHLNDNRSETYTVVTLVNCRKFLSPTLNNHDLGFYYSAIQNAHTVHGAEDLWELSTRCHDSLSYAMNNMKHLTDMGDLNFLMCKAIDNPQLTPSSSLRTALISVFDEPIVYDSCELCRRAGVEDYMGCASVHGIGPSIAVFDTIRNGHLDCAFLYPSPLHSREQMEELVGHMKRILVGGSDGEEVKILSLREHEVAHQTGLNT